MYCSVNNGNGSDSILVSALDISVGEGTISLSYGNVITASETATAYGFTTDESVMEATDFAIDTFTYQDIPSEVGVSIKATVASSTPAGDLTLTDYASNTTTITEGGDGYYQFNVSNLHPLSDTYSDITFEDISASIPTSVDIAGNTIAFLYQEDVLTNSVNFGAIDLDKIGATIDDVSLSNDNTGVTLSFGHLPDSQNLYDYLIQVDYVPTTGEYPAEGDTEYIKTLNYNGLTVYAYGDESDDAQNPYAYNYYEYFVTMLTQPGVYWKIQLQVSGTYTDHSEDTDVPTWVANCISAFNMYINGEKLETTEYVDPTAVVEP